MGEMDRHAGLAPDPDHLAHRSHQADRVAGFVALMGIVDAAADRRLMRDRDHLFGLGEALRRVEQAGGEPDRPFAHALGGQLLHRLELGCGGRAGILPQHALPDRAEAGERDDVGADPRRLQLVRIGADIGGTVAVDPDHDGAGALIEPGGIDPFRLVGRADEGIGMGVRIDEAGGDDHALGVDHAPGAELRHRADIDDPIAAQGDIADIGLAVAAVIDGAALDQHVGGLGRGSERRDRNQRRRQQQSAQLPPVDERGGQWGHDSLLRTCRADPVGFAVHRPASDWADFLMVSAPSSVGCLASHSLRVWSGTWSEPISAHPEEPVPPQYKRGFDDDEERRRG